MPNENILIVEDEEIVSKSIQSHLQKSGYRIAGRASTGEAAIAEAEKKRPDLVLMDIDLQGEMDGINAAEQIRSRFDTPVIYLTFYYDENVLARAKATNPSGIIMKPLRERELLVAVEMALYKHKTEYMLREKDRFNELLLDALPCPTMLINKELKVLAANRIARDFGVRKGAQCWSVFNARDLINRDKYRPGVCPGCRADEALSSGRDLNSYGAERLGKFWDISWIPLGDDIFLHYATDVTPYKQTEETLKKAQDELENRVKKRTKALSKINVQLQNEIAMRREGEEKIMQNQKILQSIFDGITDPLMLLGPDMTVMLSNKAAYKYYRISDSQVFRDGHCHRLTKNRQDPCDDCMVQTVMGAVVKQKKPAIFERQGVMDTNRIEQITVYPVAASENDTTGAIVRICDVTDTKRMQMNLIQNEKLAALGFLISSIAHEINNPNNLITFNVPIMRDYIAALLPIIDEHAERHCDFTAFGMSYPEFREDIFKLLDNIEHGSSRINSTVSGLKEFVRVDAPMKKTAADLKSVIAKAISICSIQINKKVKKLLRDIPDNLPPVLINPRALEQVLVNLLVNAAQAANKSDSWIKICVVHCKEEWIIEIIDNGCGMDETTKRKLFDPFFTTKNSKEGTGLGLYVSQTLIEGLGGKLEVQSEIGEGTVFRIILPDGEK